MRCCDTLPTANTVRSSCFVSKDPCNTLYKKNDIKNENLLIPTCEGVCDISRRSKDFICVDLFFHSTLNYFICHWFSGRCPYHYKITIFIGDGTARSAADGDDVDADGQGTRAGATATADEGTLTGKGREPAATMMTA